MTSTITPTMTTTTATAEPEPQAIDMLNPTQALAALHVESHELLALVNGAQLAAYDLGGNIRFRYCDVSALASRLAIAA